MQDYDGENKKITLIEPAVTVEGWGITEIVKYRELLYGMILRDFQTIRNQTYTAWFWRLLQPTFIIITYTILFEHIGSVNFVEGVPYFFLMSAAMLPWQLFNTIVIGSVSSIVSNTSIFDKVYFPRAILPLVSVTNAVFDFVLASLLLLGLLVFMGMPISWNIILFPLYGAWALVLGLSIGLLLAALNCIYKEIYQSIGYVLQVGFFFSPVLYPASSVPDKYLQYYQMNPMVGVIDGFRWCFIQQGSPPNMSDVVGMTLTLLMFVAALHVFRKIEPLMSDLK